MKVTIIGGTGFLGYHATHELIRHEHKVSIIALPPLPSPGLFPNEVHILLKDIRTLADSEIEELLAGQDVLIFAAGADDRVTPRAPAYPFFYQHNVLPVQRLARLCVQSGVRKMIILGSYFAYFDRIWPQLELAKHHPYIRSRVEQTKQAIESGGMGLEVITLELPYIFGTMPGRMPLWKPLVKYAVSGFPLFFPAGGTTCITVQQVAQAILGAVERGEPGKCYPLGGENLTWVELLSKITRFAGKEKKVITIPNWIGWVGVLLVKGLHKVQGREGGLDPVQFLKLQTSYTFINPALSQPELGYLLGGLDEALQETVSRCIES